MHYLVTGGTGYLGGHMAILLHRQGHTVTLIDNFSNSDQKALERLQFLCDNKLNFFKIDLCDKGVGEVLTSVHRNLCVDGVFHFAGLKSVSESVEKPQLYYKNNFDATVSLISIMKSLKIDNFVFSSSATVYAETDSKKINEESPLKPCNPYGESKLLVEKYLKKESIDTPSLKIAILRYFNPVGADESGLFGESPKGTPNNLMPYVFDVAVGKREEVSVYGNDYNTPDGTGVRDYIHVSDLVNGHLAALNYIESRPGSHVFNLGTGKGHSVLEMIQSVREQTNKDVPYSIKARRKGDVADVVASTDKAFTHLSWVASKQLKEMVQDQWRWHLNLNKEK